MLNLRCILLTAAVDKYCLVLRYVAKKIAVDVWEDSKYKIKYFVKCWRWGLSEIFSFFSKKRGWIRKLFVYWSNDVMKWRYFCFRFSVFSILFLVVSCLSCRVTFGYVFVSLTFPVSAAICLWGIDIEVEWSCFRNFGFSRGEY